MIKKLGKDAAIYGGSDFVFKVIAFAVFPIYAHYFSVADFGTWALLTVSASLIGVLINLGINNSVQRYYWDPETTTGQQPVIVSGGLLQLAGFGLLMVSLAVTAVFFQRNWIQAHYSISWTLIALVGGSLLLEQLLQYTLDTIRLHFNPVRFLIISFAKNLFGVSLGLYFIIQLGWGLYGYFFGAVIGSAVALPIALWFIRRELTWQLDKQISVKIFRFGFPFVFTGLAYWVFGSMDRWLLAELSTIEEVGLYSIAFKFAAIVSFIISAFAQAWSPHAIKLMRDDPDYRTVYSRIFTLWFFVLAMTGLFISLFAKELLILFTPKAYWSAAQSLVMVTAGIVVYGTTQITSIGISLQKKTYLLTRGAIIAAVANLVLNILLVPKFGAVGAGFATLLSYTLLTSSFLYWTQKFHPIPLERRKLAYSGALVGLSVLMVLFVSPYAIHGLTIAVKLFLFTLAASGALLLGIVDKKYLSFVTQVKMLWQK